MLIEKKYKIHKCCGVPEGRFPSMGYVRFHGGALDATDGRMLAHVVLPESAFTTTEDGAEEWRPEDGALIEPAVFKEASTGRGGDARLSLQEEGKGVLVEHTKAKRPAALFHGAAGRTDAGDEFPRTMELVENVRKAKPAATITLNASMLADLAQALGAANDHVTLEIRGKADPIIVTPSGGEAGTVGAIMPVTRD